MSKISNWAGTCEADPVVITEASSAEGLSAILTAPDRFPSPVRVFGSNHSTTACAMADGGTMVKLSGMDNILEIGEDFVRVQAGAQFLDVSRELERHGLEFYVNLQIGNATIGSVACCASKDASYTDVYGQANSYCTAITLVKADGSVITIDESDPQLLRATRSSYALLGIVTEATFRVRKIQPIAISHARMTIDEFLERLPGMLASSTSISYYLFPWINRVIVQERTPTDAPGKPNRMVWKLRNWATAHIVPVVARGIVHLPGRWLRNLSAGLFYRAASLFLHWFLHAKKTHGGDQTMHYKHDAGLGRFTFSLWGFPQEGFEQVLRDYIAFLKQHYKDTGYRSFMLSVGYHVKQDDSSLLSYSNESDVLTIDPTSSGEPGWDQFLDAFNAFCSARGARPLLNQTPRLTATQAQTAFGDRLQQFRELRQSWDPQDRLYNPYFRDMLG